MSKICQITGKKAQIGCNVSHSKHHTKRSFDVNLFSKKFYYVEEGCWIQLKISAAGLRMINKVGLDAALKQAVAKGIKTKLTKLIKRQLQRQLQHRLREQLIQRY